MQPRNEGLKQQAIALRRSGHLYAHIANNLGIAKSTVYTWTSDIKLSRGAAQAIAARRLAARQKLVQRLVVSKKEARLRHQAGLRDEIHMAHVRDPLSIHVKQLLCATMFWCEGGKDIASGIRFIKSDPVTIRAFLGLLRECFDIDETKLRALLHLHDYHDPTTQTAYWAELTQIPVAQFYKPYLKSHTSKNIHLDYQGCISIRYGDARLSRQLKMLYDELGNMYLGA